MPGIFDDDLPRVRDIEDAASADQPNDYSGLGTAAMVAAGLGMVGLLARKPGLLKSAAMKANAVRQQLMLTGLAVPKSVLGNTGAVVARSLETQSTSPLREFFSMKTARDAASAFKNARQVGPVGRANTTLPFPLDLPGRTMGALDEATQLSLQRGRVPLAAKEAEAALFQSPLGENYGKLGDTLDSPAAKYLLPFRRTPFNQFSEGLKTFKSGYANPGVRNAYMGVGAVHGAATSDDQFPVSIPLATAGAAKYGVPYAVGALAGRVWSGGKDSAGIAGSMLPVSEYGIEQSISDPVGPFFDPSFTRVMDKF